MSEALAGAAAGRANRHESVNAGALGAAAWLRLAAAPTFAAMALVTGDGGASPIICSAAHNASPLGGMATMYVLMGVFSLSPWLKWLGRRRRVL